MTDPLDPLVRTNRYGYIDLMPDLEETTLTNPAHVLEASVELLGAGR
ncbi:hypothetical protein [Aeromicrobium sp. P5_D10]